MKRVLAFFRRWALMRKWRVILIKPEEMPDSYEVRAVVDRGLYRLYVNDVLVTEHFQ